MDPVPIHYARSRDGTYIAYQVTGEGPIDLVLAFGFGISVEDQATGRWSGQFIERLSSFARVIRFDRRGTGLSDPVASIDQSTWESWCDDALAVLDAVGSNEAAVATTDITGSTNACLFWVTTHPERFNRLVLFDPFARFTVAPDYPIGAEPELIGAMLEQLMRVWFDDDPALPPMRDIDDDFLQWFTGAARRGLSPSTALALYTNAMNADFRAVLPSVRVPTLVIARCPDELQERNLPRMRYVADHISGAKFVELPGDSLFAYTGDSEAVAQEIEEFCTGTRSEAPPDRALATVLFTDLVQSTEQATRVGDKVWRARLDAHDAMVRAELATYRGHEIKTLGDGFLATFDGPARAIKCGAAIVRGAQTLGQPTRVGLHTGEVELRGDDIGGVTVNIAARVVAQAHASEVLVSRTVVDLVAGSGLAFTDRGEHALKGIEGVWRLFALNAT